MTCAYAVRVAIMKFPGVEAADVSLNKGLATVKLKPGNTFGPANFGMRFEKRQHAEVDACDRSRAGSSWRDAVEGQ